MSIAGLDTWLHSPQGKYVMAWERSHLDAIVVDVFGYNAIQLGLPQIDLLAQNRIPLRQVAGDSGRVDLVCDMRQLPFATHSIDLLVMAHVLEFHDDPHQILREVERVLIPEGEVLITGFNPISLWGLRRRMPNCPDHFPWTGNYLTALRLRDWLKLLGFELDRVRFGCYAPPCQQARWLKRWALVETIGARWWGFSGAVYLLRAVKRVHGVRLILPGWKRQMAPRKPLSVVSQRQRRAHER